LNLIRVMPAKGLDNMNASNFLARLLGPLPLVLGLSMAVNRKAHTTFENFDGSQQ
jgi:hypothetical protein